MDINSGPAKSVPGSEAVLNRKDTPAVTMSRNAQSTAAEPISLTSHGCSITKYK